MAATSLTPGPGGPTSGTAFEVSGLPAAFAAITSVSCASAGNCSADGYYDNVGRQNKQRAFIFRESQQNPG